MLWLAWDPLGGEPSEYVRYAPSLLDVVTSTEADPERVTEVLSELRSRYFEVAPNGEADLHAAWVIEMWWRWFFHGEPGDLDQLTAAARGS